MSESDSFPPKVYVVIRWWDDYESRHGHQFVGNFKTLEGAKAASEEEFKGYLPAKWIDYSFESSWNISENGNQDYISIELTEVGP